MLPPSAPIPSWHPRILEALLWEWAALGAGEGWQKAGCWQCQAWLLCSVIVFRVTRPQSGQSHTQPPSSTPDLA